MKQAPTETQNTLFPSLDHVRNLLREGIESSLWMTRRQEGKNTRIYTPQCLGTEDSAFAGTTSITPPLLDPDDLQGRAGPSVGAVVLGSLAN